jgi:O-antigen/teichoic acid export membrane protein
LFDFLKSLLKSGKYFLFTDILDRAVSFVIFLIFAKSLTTSVYGQVITLFALTSIFSILFDFGLPVFIQKESARYSNLSKLYSDIILLKLVLSFIYILTCFLAFYIFITSIDIKLFFIILAITLLVSLGNTLKFFFYGRDNSKLVFNASILTKLFLLILIFGIFLVSHNVYLFLFGYLLSYIFLFLFLLIKLKLYDVNYKKFYVGLGILKSTFLLILPLGFASIFNILYDRIDILLLKYFLDFDKVAQYNVAYLIYKVGTLPFSAILYPSFNRFSEINNDKKKLLVLLKKLSIVILITSLFLTLIFGLILPDLLVKVFGTKYLGASNLLPFLSFSIIFVGSNNLTGVLLNSMGKFKANMIATFCGLSINIILNLILIPALNTMGAVYATIITESLILIVGLIFIYFYLNIKNPLKLKS